MPGKKYKAALAQVDRAKRYDLDSALTLLEQVKNHPISFEVFADDLPGMIAQGRAIASWGKNVNVKIPITNTKGQSTLSLARRLLDKGLKLNMTAIFTQYSVATPKTTYSSPWSFSTSAPALGLVNMSSVGFSRINC